MGMKEETRRTYREEIYAHKKSLMACRFTAEQRDQALREAGENPRWQGELLSLWDDLEKIESTLEIPSVDTVDTSNSMRNCGRKVRRFVADLTGTTAPVEEDPIALVPAESAQKQVIEHIVRAGETLIGAYEIAVAANPMAENLELFKDIKQMSAKILALPREIARIRGLA